MRLNLQRTAEKSRTGSFGLLVIPVDFQDQRFSETSQVKSISDMVFGPDPESLVEYFQVASEGRLRLLPQLAPVVHLPGTRADYSDIGWHGFSRSRDLARQALEATADLGLDFALLDADGPDGVPGSGDDDGQVDGVLLVHAGPGQENDPEDGLIQALQYYLAQPVFQQGIAASFYATVSAVSGPGVWAHEVGHLLGMEDRYDPTLAPAGQSEVISRGGLGIFSLMASGAWGTGDGHGAALPDGYTLLEMGWAEVEELAPYRDHPVALRAVAGGGRLGRLTIPESAGREYFLLEVRQPDLAGPFDAAVPEGQMVIYHVDADLAEGQAELDGLSGWHLRVGVVEADGDDSLHDGRDAGSAMDVFPGLLERHEVPALGKPCFNAYGFLQPGYALSDIRTTVEGVVFTVVPSSDEGLEFSFGVDPQLGLVSLAVMATGQPLAGLTCEIGISETIWGSFGGGSSSVTVDLVDDGAGVYHPSSSILWEKGQEPPAGATTVFTFHFAVPGGSFPVGQRSVIWKQGAAQLDFRNFWPGAWRILGSTETTWNRWDVPVGSSLGDADVLACTGGGFSTADAWPDVQYTNGADATLVSPPLGVDVMGVRLVHVVEAEVLSGKLAMDGGMAWWMGPGNPVPAVPMGGYPHRLSPRSDNVLKDQGVFAADTLSFHDDRLVWLVDVFPLPAARTEPLSLGLQFGSNGLWRRRGWFVAGVEPLYQTSDLVPFAADWEDPGSPQQFLRWNWPWPAAQPGEFLVQALDPADGTWLDIGVLAANENHGVRGSALDAMLGPDRPIFRLLAVGPPGWVATRPVVMAQIGVAADDGLPGAVWPNPGRPPIRIESGLAVGTSGRLAVFDLRGRLIRRMDLRGGDIVSLWDGTDNKGDAVPAGLYLIRLEGLPGQGTRKVVLLR